MQDNLVIVESPAKAKTIEKFLGSDYKVMSSYGHIRDLKKKELSLDEKTLQPDYVIPKDKADIVKKLRECAKDKKVWLASDEDREGEAISWHLCEVLGLDEASTNRIVFHEITKPAILAAIANPRHLDMNLVNAQQARRVLDRLVGFKVSPVLWRKVKPGLSAGRVQSVTVRLIVDREREIQQFNSEPYYRVSALFGLTNADGSASEVKADLDRRFSTHDEAVAFLEACTAATFSVGSVTKEPTKRSPAAPFTTYTLQQEAARKLGFTVSQTMMVAQRLYESGLITYMRTDSVNLSNLCINAAKEEITRLYGEEYSQPHTYHTNVKGAQEAHEAIRPTYMNNTSIEGTSQERRLYDLIWKRTIACQMADAQIEKTTATIDIQSEDHAENLHGEKFVAQGEVIKFDGFLKVYHESTDDDEDTSSPFSHRLPAMNEGDILQRREISATERFSRAPARYTEASLVEKLRKLGIGRPSTTATIISTIQQREYVQKGDKAGEERPYTVDVLRGKQVTTVRKTEITGREKGKLLPTDIGMVVNDFLIENFPEIMDYNFTATIEQQFDRISEGDEQWTDMMQGFDAAFEPNVEKVMNARSEHKAGERQLGVDPASGQPVFVKIGRYGPVVQIGEAGGEEKPRFAHIPADKSMETLTLDEALEMFRLPRTVGEFEGSSVVIGTGRFGPYVMHDKKYVSLAKDDDPMTVTLDHAIQLILQKRQQEAQRHIKSFDEDAKLEVLNGRYGPYIAYDGKNYRLPKELHDKAAELTYEKCMEIVNAAPAPKKTRSPRRKS